MSAAVMAVPRPDARRYRLTALDMLRGLVIVIMAIDHVRDYFLMATSQDPMVDPNIGVGLFATRWITHFCAPVFVWLAGTSAGLMTARRTSAQLARFLLIRGLWLVIVEAVIVSTEATFAPRGIPEIDGLTAVIMQVIWAIGAGMIVLAGLQYLGRRVCLAVGVFIVAGHNLLDAWWPVTQLFDRQWPVWVALHAQMSVRVGPFLLLFIYPVLPWIGVMLTGFGVAGVFERPQAGRNRMVRAAGIAMVGAFVLLRAIDGYGDPNHWQVQPGGPMATVIDFLNTTKYPPSLLFLLMTLGPAAILCSFADRLTGPVKGVLVVFGRVPFAFYVAHVLLIHLLSVGFGMLQGFNLHEMLTVFLFFPKGYGVTLPWVYVIWSLVIGLLYPFCRWMADLKARRRDWWLSYV